MVSSLAALKYLPTPTSSGGSKKPTGAGTPAMDSNASCALRKVSTPFSPTRAKNLQTSGMTNIISSQ